MKRSNSRNVRLWLAIAPGMMLVSQATDARTMVKIPNTKVAAAVSKAFPIQQGIMITPSNDFVTGGYPLPKSIPTIKAIADLYDTIPNIGACNPGVLKTAEKNKALARLNSVRVASGLPPVIYDSANDHQTSQSSLMSVANSQLSHTPSSSWYCFSQDGYTGSNTGNLFIKWGSNDSDSPTTEYFIDGWLIDYNVSSLGHRRWLLNPFLAQVSFGRVDGTPLVGGWNYAAAATIKVIYGSDADISGSGLQYVAYPVGNYPSALFRKDWYLSFGVIADTSSRWANDEVSYSQTGIEVTGPNGSLAVTNIGYDNDGYGLPNNLQWKVTGLQDDVPYSVHINNVNVNGVLRNYTYNLLLVQSLPAVVANGASSITATGATLNGIVTPNGATTTVKFAYGVDSANYTEVAATPSSIGAEQGATAVSTNVTALTCGTGYQYVVKANNTAGEVTSPVQNFTTAACVSYTVTPSTDGNGTVSPNTPQTIPHGTAANFTVAANSGYTRNNIVTGTCPQNSWNGNTWTTGAITTNCTVIFSFTSVPSDTPLNSGVTLHNQTVALNAWNYYYMIVPEGARKLTFTTSNATADIDIYTQVGNKPTKSSYVCRPYANGGNETCIANNPSAGTWWLGIYGYKASNYSVLGTVESDAVSYIVTPSVSTGGEVIPNTPQNVTSGTTTSFTVTTDTGYTRNNTVTGTCPQGVWSNNIWTTGFITANCNLEFGFIPNSYAITTIANPADGGTINCTPNSVTHGSSSACTVIANAGYTTSANVGGTCPQGAWSDNIWTTGPIVADCTLGFNFTINQYAITTQVMPTVGGTLTCTPNPVMHGSSSTCNATPAANYQLANFSGDCTGSTCILTNITGPKVVTANFTMNTSGFCHQCLPSMKGWRSAVALLRQIPNSRRTRTMAIHKITPSAGTGGTIIPNTMRLVLNSTKSMFTITPEAGKTATVTGTCGGAPTTGTAAFTYNTNPVSRDCTIGVSFATTPAPLNKVADLDTAVDTAATKATDLPAWQFTSTAATTYTVGGNATVDLNTQALPASESSAFDFTKLDASGHVLPAEAEDYTCLRDNATGLVWESKTQDGGLQDQKWSYTWYDANKPGDHTGTASGGTCYTVGRCDSEKYTHDVNARALCGGKDWRLPTVAELATIAGSALTQHQPPTWAAFEPNMADGYNAMVVNFTTGHIDPQPRSVGNAVLLVQ